MKKRHVNIPIFIPHLGCPNNCVFCNQRTISGHGDFKIESVRYEIESALSTLSEDTEREIAFFGGSFTGIDRELMIELLELAQRYVNKGLVSEIRLSTRPDYIDGEILDILSRYSVKLSSLGFKALTTRCSTLQKEDTIPSVRFLLVGQSRNVDLTLLGR